MKKLGMFRSAHCSLLSSLFSGEGKEKKFNPLFFFFFPFSATRPQFLRDVHLRSRRWTPPGGPVGKTPVSLQGTQSSLVGELRWWGKGQVL